MEIGTNIYASLNPANIDLLCVYAVAYWYMEIEHYDFDNPKFAGNTGNGQFACPAKHQYKKNGIY